MRLWAGASAHFIRDTTHNQIAEKLTDLVKNTYRVLLTRGLKGCYVYIMDPETRAYIAARAGAAAAAL